MKQKFVAKTWKRALSTGLSLAMAVTMIPTAGIQAAEEDTTILKAGSIDVAADSITKKQPFVSGAGSKNFSSPALTVRQVKAKGTDGDAEERPTEGITTDLLIAAAEAKYDVSGERGGQDIVASVSSDGGETWKYSYPIKFPDSVNNGVTDATTVSDPVLVQQTQMGADNDGEFVTGGKVYLLANVYPGGVAPAEGFTYPGAGTGYVEIDGKKYLALTDAYEKAAVNPTDASSDYAYYIGEFADGYAPVNSKADKSVATIDSKQYYVDEWFNLYTKEGETYTAAEQENGQLDAEEGAADKLQQNVFYKGSKFHVYNTGYIMCVTSEKTGDLEEGDSWSVPQILNAQLDQTEDELLFLNSGKGLATTAGRLVVPVTSKKKTESESVEEAESTAGIIWKYDDCDHGTAGTPWAHRADVPAFTDAETNTEEPSWMEGGEIVELSRGQLRMFIRHGRGNVFYADAGRGLVSSDEGGEEPSADSTGDDADNTGAAGTDMFEFKAPVQTGTSVTRDSKVSALGYSKIINPGSDSSSKAILTAMPTGTGHTNGMFTVFGRDADSDVKNPTMSRIHSKALSNGNFASASMDEMNYGSNVGLLWENGRGSVKYENFYMLDLLANARSNEADSLYVKGLEYDLELRPNGTPYTRNYNVTGKGNMEPSDKDWAGESNANIDVTFSPGTVTNKTLPALYSRERDGSNNAKLSDVFGSEPDARINYADAEFILTRPSEAENLKNVYTVYSESAERYLTNYVSGETFFSTTLRNNMRFVYDSNKTHGSGEGFLISKPKYDGSEPATDGSRYLVFDKHNYTFDTYGTLQSLAETAQFTHHIQLLRKLMAEELESVNAEDVINLGAADSNDYKYIKVTGDEGILPGRKYLMGYEIAANSEDAKFADGGYVILYPRNGVTNYGKLVYKTFTAPVVATKTLTITPKAATTRPVDLTVNNITYHITVKNETIEIPKGGSVFIDNAEMDEVNLGATTLVTKLAAQESRKALFDCIGTANDSLSGYSDTPNWEANVANAEVVITRTGQTEAETPEQYYTIFSELEGNYLVNADADEYFGKAMINQRLIPVTNEDGTISFEIRRYSPGNNNDRYVYFYYPRMAFDASSVKSDTFVANGDFKLEILKKRTDGIEDMSDPIPGYQRATEIESGGSYLITEYYKEKTGDKRDVIIVLYPRNGKVNQSKMYATTEVPGVRLTAAENAETGDTAEITIGGVTYTIEISGTCDHDYPKTVTSVKATCKKKGSTGDVICSNCREVLKAGEETDMLTGHTWPEEWEVTEPTINRTAKTVSDGVKTRTCSGGEESEKEILSGEAYLNKVIGDAIADAQAEAGKTDEYAAETIKALQDAILAATTAVSGQTPADVAGKIDALVGLETALDPDNMVSQEDYNDRKDELDELLADANEAVSKTDLYTKESLDALQDVLDDIEDMKDADGKISYADMQTAISNLTTAMGGLKTLDQQACEELLPELKEALESIEPVVAGGQKNYTDDSWKKLIDAYNKLKGKTDAELVEMGINELNQILAGLRTKLVEKPKTDVKTETKLQVNTDHTISGGVYTVTDAVKNEVVLKKGANAKKFTVPATVSVNGITCKVVGIGKGAFSGYKKLKNVIIGENVATIEANAFFKCTKLSKVTINGAKAPAIKKAAFKKTASKVTVKAKKLNKKQKKAFLKKLKKTGKISKKSVVK